MFWEDFSIQGPDSINIGSSIISTFSVVYGYAELLAMFSNAFNTDYPFAKTMWGMAALLIDTLLRWSTCPLVFVCSFLEHVIYLKLINK